MQFVSQYLCDIRLYVPFDRYSRSLIEVDNLFQAIGCLYHVEAAFYLKKIIYPSKRSINLPSDPAFVPK